jgi:hypothetical protein
MKKRIALFFWLSILFIFIFACTLPNTMPTPTPVINIDATFTSIALTQFALQTLPAPQEPTALPSATLLPTLASTLAPSAPMITVSVDTNCRSGPGANFAYLSALLVGEQAEVVGKYAATSPGYWIIKKGTVTCWLWGKYATVQGDTNALPEMVPPPSPTPSCTPSPLPTATFTQTASPVPQAKGDLVLIEFFQLANHNIAIRVGTNPISSLSGSYVYTVWADGAKVKETTCTIPVGTELCDTGYAVVGTQGIEVVIDTNNLIFETNEANNIMFLTCASDWTCK